MDAVLAAAAATEGGSVSNSFIAGDDGGTRSALSVDEDATGRNIDVGEGKRKDVWMLLREFERETPASGSAAPSAVPAAAGI